VPAATGSEVALVEVVRVVVLRAHEVETNPRSEGIGTLLDHRRGYGIADIASNDVNRIEAPLTEPAPRMPSDASSAVPPLARVPRRIVPIPGHIIAVAQHSAKAFGEEEFHPFERIDFREAVGSDAPVAGRVEGRALAQTLEHEADAVDPERELVLKVVERGSIQARPVANHEATLTAVAVFHRREAGTGWLRTRNHAHISEERLPSAHPGVAAFLVDRIEYWSNRLPRGATQPMVVGDLPFDPGTVFSWDVHLPTLYGPHPPLLASLRLRP
jgi:hypothetical protein